MLMASSAEIAAAEVGLEAEGLWVGLESDGLWAGLEAMGLGLLGVLSIAEALGLSDD